jgi:DHA1 family tetracycline resistance protein-like MFS transporter
MGIAGLFGPSVFTLTFATFIGPRAPLSLPGAPFLLASSLLVVAWILAFAVTRGVPPAAITRALPSE